MPNKLTIGYPDQWQAFEKRNAKFIEHFPSLKKALDLTFVREFTTVEPAERTIFFLGRLCIEDFMELLCLAANGYGFGALKLLRGLYERAVTASYLSNNQDEAALFLSYRFVLRHKTLQAYIESGSANKELLGCAKEARENFEKVKSEFQIDDCKKCGTKRTNHTWCKLDFVSMAKKTSLGKLLAQAYYEPLKHTHSTPDAMLKRLALSQSEQFLFSPEPQPKEADQALMIAHALMVEVIGVQARFFKSPDLEKQYDLCARDHAETWSNRKITADHTT